MSEEVFPTLIVKTATCRTGGCGNENIPITLPCADTVFCGVCGSEITDIEEVD